MRFVALPLVEQYRFTLPSGADERMRRRRGDSRVVAGRAARIVTLVVMLCAALLHAHAESVELRYERMTPDERIAQMLLLGWDGAAPNDLIMRWISERGLGGVKVFGRNADDPAALAATLGEMQRAAAERTRSIPLFTATDQEGGMVRHVRGNTSRGAGNMAIGATGLPSDAYEAGRHIAAEMRALGINMNFAPTVDVYRNPRAEIIGSRSFGDDPVEIGLLGLALFRSHENKRVIAAAKHFPGHGDATGDSHVLLPELEYSRDELYDHDLVPYRMLIREGVPAILGAHLAFPHVTGSRVPATLSPKIMTDLLRDELGFDGLLITDDMHMIGATVHAQRENLTFGELLVMAVEAGNDMIMLSQTPSLHGEEWRALREAYDERAEFRERVRESVHRILEFKDRYLESDDSVPLYPEPDLLAHVIPNPGSEEFFADHAKRAVSVVRNGALPVDPAESDRVLLTGNIAPFFSAARSYFSGADEYRFSYSPTGRSNSNERDEARRRAGQADLVVFALSNWNSLEVLETLEPYADRLVVISTHSPLLLSKVDFVETAVAVYGFEQASFEAGVEVLLGKRLQQGTVPLRELRQNDR